MSETHPALLPNGLKDLLPPEAEAEARIITAIMESFAQFGYRRVKPPLVEFEESLLAQGPGQALSRDTFRLMDPVSRHMMGVRADTTAQIARIAGSRLKDSMRPLRLSYAADILRVNGSQLRPERQFCQVGCELIGASKTQDDIEVELMALKALSDVGAKDLSIDLTIPSLIDILFNDFDVIASERDLLENAILKRDRDALEKHNTKISSCLVSLLDCSGAASEAIQKLKNIELPNITQDNIEMLLQTYDGLTQALNTYGLASVNITIDLIERRGFEYQNGVSFTLFSKNARSVLGRGGRYCVSEERHENATGFTLYMDSVQQAITQIDTEKRKTVDEETSWNEIKKLQDQGYLVSRGGAS